jgi:hypothetical protein
MPTFLDHVDFSKVEARNLVTHKLTAAPASPVIGQRYYDTTLLREGIYNGASWDYINSGAITSIGVTAPIASTGGTTPTLSITPASGSLAGSMSLSDFVKLSASTALNTASTIVQRDSSGNFTAGTITATLTGIASNAANLGAQSPAYYTARANQTGTQTSATISDFNSAVYTARLDQLAAPTSNVSLNGLKIVSLADPQNPQDGATKGYADALIATGNNKGTARVVFTTNVVLSSPGAIGDGVTLSSTTPDIVLLAGQTVPSQNGLYVFNGASVPLTRATNANLSGEIRPGLFVFAAEGTLNGSNGYTLTTPAPIVLETTALTFTQTSGAGQIVAGTAITKVGNVINAVGGVGLVTNMTNLAIDPAIVVRKYSSLIGDGTSTSITVTHNLNNPTLDYSLALAASPYTKALCTVSFPTVNTAILTFALPPSTGQYRVSMFG